MKNFIVALLMVLSFSARAEEVTNNLQKQTQNIYKSCRDKYWKDSILIDYEMDQATQKINKCLKNELISLIKQTVPDRENQNELINNFENIEKNATSFYYIAANYNQSCQSSSKQYDCGTIGKYLVASPKWQQSLLGYINFFILIKEDIEDARDY